MYTIDLNTFTLEELSHKTHPNMKLLDALYMTCCLPFLFQPYVLGDKCYIDGGIQNTYPLKNCMDRVDEHDTILGLRFNSKRLTKQIDEDNNIFEYGYFLYRSLIQCVRPSNYPYIKNEIVIPSIQMNIGDGSTAVNSKEERQKYIIKGYTIADRYLATIEEMDSMRE